jgi:hypothetical protein
MPEKPAVATPTSIAEVNRFSNCNLCRLTDMVFSGLAR